MVYVILVFYGFYCLNILVILVIIDVFCYDLIVKIVDIFLGLLLIWGLLCVNNMNFLVYKYIFLSFKYYVYN